MTGQIKKAKNLWRFCNIICNITNVTDIQLDKILNKNSNPNFEPAPSDIYKLNIFLQQT